MEAVARPTPPSYAVQRSRTLRDGSKQAACHAATPLTAILPPRDAGRLRCHCLSLPALRIRHAALLTPRAQLQEGLEAGSVSSVEASVETNNVHVRFTLKRECLFGQGFLIVGNDPNLGQWDTSSAIPLEWSEGHVWTAQLDLPIGKTVKYKFILRGLSGEIEWQPGEDRVLQPWETTKMIVVTEEWENAEKQEITEEQENNGEQRRRTAEEEQVINREQSTPDEELAPVPNSVLEDGSLRTNETLTTEQNLNTYDKSIHIDADNEKIKQRLSNDKAVLIPGLPQESSLVSGLPLSFISKVQLSEPSTSSTSGDKLEAVSEDGKESTLKVKDKEKGPRMMKELSLDELDMTNSFKDEDVEANNGEQDSLPAAKVVINDIQWGRETFNKFLSTLGWFQGESA